VSAWACSNAACNNTLIIWNAVDRSPALNDALDDADDDDEDEDDADEDDDDESVDSASKRPLVWPVLLPLSDARNACN
jgi:hypothetical protein